ncbi:MAG TPA: hypothetical protein VH639_04495 [Bryobacteraceae bacterium]|jgi:hypothetical protein
MCLKLFLGIAQPRKNAREDYSLDASLGDTQDFGAGVLQEHHHPPCPAAAILQRQVEVFAKRSGIIRPSGKLERFDNRDMLERPVGILAARYMRLSVIVGERDIDIRSSSASRDFDLHFRVRP